MEQIHCGCKYCTDNALLKYSHWVNRILNLLGPKMSSFLLKLSRVSYSHWEQNANFEYTLNTHIEYLLSMQSTFWVSLCTLHEWLHILKLSIKTTRFWTHGLSSFFFSPWVFFCFQCGSRQDKTQFTPHFGTGQNCFEIFSRRQSWQFSSTSQHKRRQSYNTIQYNPGICIAPPTTRPVAHYKEMCCRYRRCELGIRHLTVCWWWCSCASDWLRREVQVGAAAEGRRQSHHLRQGRRHSSAQGRVES